MISLFPIAKKIIKSLESIKNHSMISVCVAVHNGQKYLKSQIDSIICQLGLDDEIVISDDGSNDKTIEVIESFNDRRIKVYRLVPPKGLPSFRYATLNFENALKRAKGDFIFLADQDDVWTEDKVKVSLKYLNDYDYIVSDAYVTDSDLNIISDTRFVKEEKIHTNKYLAIFFSTPYQGSCAAFKRSVLEKSLPFPKNIQSHDRWIGNVAAFYFKTKIIPEKLIYYRRHEGTVSTTFRGSRPAGLIKTIGYKLNYVWGLISLLFKK